MERDPNKRRIKPPTNPEFINLDYDIFGESSSDSDFYIEDHCINSGSDSDVDSSFTDDDGQEIKNDNEDEIGRNDNVTSDAISVVTNDQDDSDKVDLKEIVDSIHICSICLGDDVNKLINCDNCGISVHKDCYGVHDSGSVSSSVSSCSVQPWFCETCKAGIENPSCDLCPNFGGVFKETDYGKWVHLVCALYVSDAEFGEVTSLSKIKLFENTSPRWGNKNCTLCKDVRFMWTGVAIACDAGMCRSNFHVTCAQREGCLSDATSQETDQTDPFYAHCKLHVDKLVAKKRQRNWQALQLRTKKMQLLREHQAAEKSPTWQRNIKILKEFQSKYHQMIIQTSKPDSMLKSKVPRPITTSASACRALWLKAKLMGVDMAAQEAIEGQIKTLQNIPKKLHIPLEFSMEFVRYASDRNLRLTDLNNQLKHNTDQKNILREEQIKIQDKYNEVFNDNLKIKQRYSELQKIITAYHKVIRTGNPEAVFPDFDGNIKGATHTTSKTCIGSSVKCNTNSGIIDNEAPLNLNNKCGICSHSNDQHLLVKCDTCYLYYHLGCLNPPLTRFPKKTKLFGWQCSECDSSSSNSEIESVDTNAPRKLRHVFGERSVSDSRGSSIVNKDLNSLIEQNKLLTKNKEQKQPSNDYDPKVVIKRNEYLKCKQKHHEANITSKVKPTCDSVKEPSHQRTKLFVDPVPHLLVVSQADEKPQTSVKPKTEKSMARPKITATSTGIKTSQCFTCKTTGSSRTMVQCAECSEHYHFTCLVPPVKKSPAVRGYSWHCAECDPTDSDTS